MRVVLDTSVLVAAIRSSHGAASAILDAGLQGRFEILISTPLLLEYESVLTRAEHLAVSAVTSTEIGELIDSICSVGVEVAMTRSWRPQLPDPDDEMVLETALNGRADVIATHNRADFAIAAVKFGIGVLTPQEILRRIRAI